MVTIVVIGGIRLYREGLTRFLEGEAGFRVVGTADTFVGAVEKATALRPDIALIDLALPNAATGIAAVARVEGVRVVVLGIRDHDGAILACAEAGIAGYVTRDGSLDELVATISCAARGELACPPRVAGLLLRRVAALAAERSRHPTDSRLTPREREILSLLEQGLSNKEIAARLRIEVATVKNHVHNVLEKLGVRGRAAAVAAVRRSELASVLPPD